ncbi:MAG: mechanosensitive ion channel family protein [Gallionellaceae bacterium]
MENLYFIASVLLLFIVIKICLLSVAFLNKKLSRRWQDILKTLYSPIVFLVVMQGFQAWVRLPFFPVEFLEAQTQLLMNFALIWLVVRFSSMCLFTLYLKQLNGISTPKVLVWVSNKFLYLCSLIAYLNLVQGFSLGDLIVTTAVILVAFGIGFQRPLGEFISEVSASFRNTAKYGDLIQIGDLQGVVVESKWWQVKILDANGNHISYPVQKMLQEPVINFSSRGNGAHFVTLTISINGSISPGTAEKILAYATASLSEVEKTPAPRIYHEQAHDNCIKYTVCYSLRNHLAANEVNSKIRTLVWYKLRRHGLASPFASTQEIEIAKTADQHAYIAGFIRNLELFATLSPEMVNKLASLCKLGIYAPSERVLNQGEKGESLYIICSGKVSILLNPDTIDKQKTETLIKTLTSGNIIGEMSLLTGAAYSASAVITEESTLIHIRKEAFKEILVASPDLVETLTDIMLKRQESDEQRKQKSDNGSVQKKRSTLLSQIKSFFQL